MSLENQQVERKSLRKVTGSTADWGDLARTGVCFANGSGGKILVGIEDGAELPPAGQVISEDLPERIRRRIGELTVNVQALPRVVRAANGGEYVEVAVERSPGVASTSDGRYFLRIGDTCAPVTGDEIMRLANERPGQSWELMESRLSADAADAGKLAALLAGIRASDRVKPSVREKSDDELLAHYGLVRNGRLTHLGVLVVGTAADRRALGTAPIVQAIKYDEQGQKINKWTWDDGTRSPVELVQDVWQGIPDFRDSYEIPEGMFRNQIPAYDEKVVRELLVNALVHRPYTQTGDIYLNLHPDRLEIVNPGRLPLGVTPGNILHASRRRNEELARLFHDLGLMEREGSGYDLIYDRLLSQGRPAPVPEEGSDWVKVTIQRRIAKPAVIRLIADLDARYQLTQRERITLGLLAQSEGMTAGELAQALEVQSTDEIASWLGRLPRFELVQTAGKTRATRYFIPPDLPRKAGIPMTTSLKRIEPPRLDALVREDLERHPGSKVGDILPRVGAEIGRSQLRGGLKRLTRRGEVVMIGIKNGARYWLAEDWQTHLDQKGGNRGADLDASSGNNG